MSWISIGGDEEDTKDRTKQKACLERYRKACIEIMGVLNKAAPQVCALPACPKVHHSLPCHAVPTLQSGRHNCEDV